MTCPLLFLVDFEFPSLALLRPLDLLPLSSATSLLLILINLLLRSLSLFPVLLLHLWLLLPVCLDLKLETKCVDPSSLALRPCLSLSGKDRVTRAWTCGQWAAAVRAARIGSPDRTPPIDFKNRFYAVLKARGLEKATIFRSSAGYWACIGSLSNSDSISQSFPSEVEAKIILQAAGEIEILFAP